MEFVLMLPGLGAQYPNMVDTFVINHPESKANIENIITFGRDYITSQKVKLLTEQIEQLETQIQIHALNLAFYQYEAKQFKAQYLCGHSLGFYAAAVIAESISLSDSIKLIVDAYLLSLAQKPLSKKKSKYKIAVITMFECIPEQSLTELGLEILSLNNDTQALIYGPVDSYLGLNEHHTDNIFQLDEFTNGLAFHASHMKPVSNSLAEKHKNMCFKTPVTPLASHIKPVIISTKEQVREHLFYQISMMVNWPQTINLLKSKGVEGFVEVGPSRVLSQMTKRINPKATIETLDKYKVKKNKRRSAQIVEQSRAIA